MDGARSKMFPEEEDGGSTPGPRSAGRDESDAKAGGTMLGGSSNMPCFALLDGIVQDPDANSQARVTIPITRLPAILGRTHETNDPHFFGLGKKKALSRKQCLIEYRAGQDGRVEWDDDKQKLVYKEKTDSETGGIDMKDLPAEGYFAIGSMGKNRIMVNQERIAQGKVALLRSGTPIRISNYMLYFLLPTDALPETFPSPGRLFSVSKKRKIIAPDNVASSGDASKKAKTPMGASFQAELDAMPVEALLERMTEAINNNEWERKHQLIGSTIALHAVRAAAMDPHIQATASRAGVSRSTIMSWIEKSDKYREWVLQMLTKMEPRSYQAAVTKSLLKTGFTRTGSSGRYIKWLLPEDVQISGVRELGNEDANTGGGNHDEDGGEENDDSWDERGAVNENDGREGKNNDGDGDHNGTGPLLDEGSDNNNQKSYSELDQTAEASGVASNDDDDDDVD